MTEDDDVAIQLPQGIELAKLEGINIPSGDIGSAFQLSKFCETFGEDSKLNSIATDVPNYGGISGAIHMQNNLASKKLNCSI
ncbi:hypothetical protein Tco_0149258 [Tanacetum coccineum]